MRSQFEFNSFNEVSVKGYHWYAPDVKPKGIVVLSHGMAESILRYERFANDLLASNLFVYGHSHRGHGDTASRPDRLGYLGEDGWNRMVSDLEQVVRLAQKTYPDVPVILFGHSMGSYVARDFLIHGSPMLRGAILSGTGYPAKLELQAATLVAGLELKIKGKDLPSERMNGLSCGSFNKKIKPLKTPFDWLSTDENEVRAYIDNPLCGQLHPTSFFKEMAANLKKMLYDQPPRDMKTDFPIYLMSGEEDPVGQYGSGVKKSAEFYKQYSQNVSMKLYPGKRHEMLNEVNREEVHRDILAWIEGQL